MRTENFYLRSNIWLLKQYSDQLLEFNRFFWYIKCFVSGKVEVIALCRLHACGMWKHTFRYLYLKYINTQHSAQKSTTQLLVLRFSGHDEMQDKEECHSQNSPWVLGCGDTVRYIRWPGWQTLASG